MVRRVIVGWLGAMLVMAAGTSAAGAQMVGAPVLQDAFLNPGVTLGLNFGSGEQAHTYGGAAAWAPSSGILQVSGGAALLDPSVGSSHVTWGLRVMAPVPHVGGRTFGVAAFAGVGGLNASGARETRLPIGVSAAYRRSLGAKRGISVYVAPFYSWSRLKQDTVSTSHGSFRVSVGVDAAVMPGLGVTVGYEGGSRARGGEPGPTGGLFGVGVSYALHHPR